MITLEKCLYLLRGFHRGDELLHQHANNIRFSLSREELKALHPETDLWLQSLESSRGEDVIEADECRIEKAITICGTRATVASTNMKRLTTFLQATGRTWGKDVLWFEGIDEGDIPEDFGVPQMLPIVIGAPYIIEQTSPTYKASKGQIGIIETNLHF